MNNKGQSLVMFIILLPILILASAFIVDTSFMMYKKNYLDSINKDVINSVKDNVFISEGYIDDLINKNDKDIVNDKIEINDSISIINHLDVDSIFGRLIGYDFYTIKSTYKLECSKYFKYDLDFNLKFKNDVYSDNYSLINNGVKFNKGFIFDDSSIVVNNYKLKNKSTIEDYFYISSDGDLIKYGDLDINVKNSKLYLKDKELIDINYEQKYLLDIVIDDSKIDIYLDKENIYSDSIDINGNELRIGSFSGLLSIFRIYNSCLSISEIKDNYDFIKG